MYKTLAQFKRAIKELDLTTVANNLFRYHQIIGEDRNETWRTSIFNVGGKDVEVSYYLGFLEEIKY